MGKLEVRGSSASREKLAPRRLKRHCGSLAKAPSPLCLWSELGRHHFNGINYQNTTKIESIHEKPDFRLFKLWNVKAMFVILWVYDRTDPTRPRGLTYLKATNEDCDSVCLQPLLPYAKISVPQVLSPVNPMDAPLFLSVQTHPTWYLLH
jgi:hypothetical protein